MKSTLFKGIFMISIVFIVLFGFILFECQLTTYYYSYQSKKIENQIYNADCYENRTLSQNEKFKCEELIFLHNNQISKWKELKCVINK